MRAEKFKAYELYTLYTLYRDQLRDALDADLISETLVTPPYLAELWEGMVREGTRATEEAARGDS